jgi:hypothetical protein
VRIALGPSRHLSDEHFADAADGVALEPRASRHLATCASCARRVAGARAVRAAIERSGEADSEIDVPSGLAERTARALRVRKRDAATINELLAGIAEVIRGATFLTTRTSRPTIEKKESE